MRADRATVEGGGNRRIDLAAPLRSGPVRHPGTVPFDWERRSGQPRSVRTRRAVAPPREAHSHFQARPEETGGSAYLDALGERELQALSLRGAAADVSPPGVASRSDDEVEVAAAIVEANKETKKQEVTPALRKQDVTPALRKQEGDSEDDEERFSDALDTISRTESFAMNCSVSGLSGVPDPVPGAEPGAQGFMMDRFLPAAQAVAVGSPQYTFRKAAAAGGTGNSGRDRTRVPASKASSGNGDDRMRRVPVQLPYQNLPPNYLSCAYPRREEHQEDDEEDFDDYDVHSTRGFSSKGCGLLPALCVKTSLLLMNPVPAMKRGKARGRRGERQFPPKGRGPMAQSPLARSSQNKHLGCDSNGESWEGVYKHKLEQKYLGQGEDGRSKTASESNHLTFWSDSRTGDASSPFHHSGAGGLSPYRSYALMSPSGKTNGSFGIGDKDDRVCGSYGSGSLERDHDHSSLVGSDHSTFKGSSSTSSGMDRLVHEDSMDYHGDNDSETIQGVLLGTKPTINANACDYQPEGQQIVERNSIVKDQYNGSLTEKISEVREPTILFSFRNTGIMKLNDKKDSVRDASQEVPLHLEDNSVIKKETIPLESLLPLPVPKSPSESWLSRTLPSVSNKSHVPSFLGIQVPTKKQAPWTSMDGNKNDHNSSRPQKIRFADGLERPISLDSEI